MELSKSNGPWELVCVGPRRPDLHTPHQSVVAACSGALPWLRELSEAKAMSKHTSRSLGHKSFIEGMSTLHGYFKWKGVFQNIPSNLLILWILWQRTGSNIKSHINNPVPKYFSSQRPQCPLQSADLIKSCPYLRHFSGFSLLKARHQHPLHGPQSLAWPAPCRCSPASLSSLLPSSPDTAFNILRHHASSHNSTSFFCLKYSTWSQLHELSYFAVGKRSLSHLLYVCRCVC